MNGLKSKDILNTDELNKIDIGDIKLSSDRNN